MQSSTHDLGTFEYIYAHANISLKLKFATTAILSAYGVGRPSPDASSPSLNEILHGSAWVFSDRPLSYTISVHVGDVSVLNLNADSVENVLVECVRGLKAVTHGGIDIHTEDHTLRTPASDPNLQLKLLLKPKRHRADGSKVKPPEGISSFRLGALHSRVWLESRQNIDATQGYEYILQWQKLRWEQRRPAATRAGIFTPPLPLEPSDITLPELGDIVTFSVGHTVSKRSKIGTGFFQAIDSKSAISLWQLAPAVLCPFVPKETQTRLPLLAKTANILQKFEARTTSVALEQKFQQLRLLHSVKCTAVDNADQRLPLRAAIKLSLWQSMFTQIRKWGRTAKTNNDVPFTTGEDPGENPEEHVLLDHIEDIRDWNRHWRSNFSQNSSQTLSHPTQNVDTRIPEEEAFTNSQNSTDSSLSTLFDELSDHEWLPSSFTLSRPPSPTHKMLFSDEEEYHSSQSCGVNQPRYLNESFPHDTLFPENLMEWQIGLASLNISSEGNGALNSGKDTQRNTDLRNTTPSHPCSQDLEMLDGGINSSFIGGPARDIRSHDRTQHYEQDCMEVTHGAEDYNEDQGMIDI